VRIAILNDVHLNLTYDYGCSFPFCYDHGMYGLDPPSQLVDTLLDDMQRQYPYLDAILIQGDSLIHGLSVGATSPTNNWPQQKIILQTLLQKVSQRFTTTPILLNIGNNDVLVHYSAPKLADKAMFYGDLKQMLFLDIPQNDKWRTLYGELEITMLDGGYYKYNISSDLSVLVINSIYFGIKNS
jgi:hypothetical protein